MSFASTAIGVSHLVQSTRAGAELVDFTTTISFLIAPVIAIFNFRIVTGRYFEKKYQPSRLLKILSYLGIIFLTSFATFFIITRI
ncbi:MAG: hypothetical protein NPMRTH4_1920003 [Nitrosopumilales archaeon]|nr:MAG: hypothetical protein NPMRTH4_1920003 [Nitrosopumilales archaeon]